ncbi:MAG: acetate--CoA ligase [Neisseriaceae bacterium]
MSEIHSITDNSLIYRSSPEFTHNANLTKEKYDALCKKADDDYLRFWADLAYEKISWKNKFTSILNDKDIPFYKWFEDGLLNVSYNCLDRHLTTISDKIAIIFESDSGQVEKISYRELYKKVCKFANGLKSIGVNKNDRVIIYMPHSIETIVAMQAIVRIGAIHSVVFGGFSAKSLGQRIIDARAEYIITIDGYTRGGKEVLMKSVVDQAISDVKEYAVVKHVIMHKRSEFGDIGNNSLNDHQYEYNFKKGRDILYNELTRNQADDCEPEWVNSEHPLFILYTSGSTGTPKGVQHSSAGYLLGTIVTMEWVFDYKGNDCFWCTADVGWITGHSYVCYGPLAVGATQVIFEGLPTYPDASRFWQMIEKHRVNVFYTAPTAIRTLIKQGSDLPKQYDLSSLRLLGSVGEPINPKAWQWYYDIVGNKSCPIVDTWWQTETGCHLLAPIPGVIPLKPGSCTKPIPGIIAGIVDENGNEIKSGESGYLVIKKPFPSQLRTVWGNDKRYEDGYYPQDIASGKYYVAGDSAYLDSDNYFWILGRVDDIINVSGHRLGTMEIESALVMHPAIAEAAVVGKPHEIKGESVFAFVICKSGIILSSEEKVRLIKELNDIVIKEIGSIAKPDEIRFGEALPKTRSGKIMRRLLKSIAKGEQITQDISTLENPAIIEQLIINIG